MQKFIALSDYSYMYYGRAQGSYALAVGAVVPLSMYSYNFTKDEDKIIECL